MVVLATAEACAEAIANGVSEVTIRHREVVTDAGAETIARAMKGGNRTLKVLELRSCQLSNNGAKILARGLEKCSALTKLFLFTNDIGDQGTMALANAIKSCNKLQELYLYENRVSDSGAAALARAIPLCPALQILFLGGNKISNNGAVALAGALLKCKSLQKISLRNNLIGDVGLAALAKAFKQCPTLETVYFHDNVVEDWAPLVETVHLSPNMRIYSFTPIVDKAHNASRSVAARVAVALFSVVTIDRLRGSCALSMFPKHLLKQIFMAVFENQREVQTMPSFEIEEEGISSGILSLPSTSWREILEPALEQFRDDVRLGVGMV